MESSDVDINNMLEDIEENLDLDTLMKQKQMLQKKLGLEGTFFYRYEPLSYILHEFTVSHYTFNS